MGEGHVFVLQGDPAQLATDATLACPPPAEEVTQAELTDTWAQALGEAAARAARAPGHGRERALLALALPEGSVGGDRVAVLEAGLAAAARTCAGEGTPDVVVLAEQRADYAALQLLRSRAAGPVGPETRRLAELARAGRLVAFLGAGVSRAAGVPGWQELIAALARRAGLDDAECERLLGLRPWDAAEIIAGRLDVPTGEAIERELGAPGGQHSITHGLIASLRLPGVITTNWDDRYERAARVPTAGTLRVLPRDLTDGSGPWLLKLHGDLADPDSIVLTRDDSLDFDANRVPLASVLQSHMLTHHLLLLGYSLSDDSFVRLARQVRALHGARSGDGPQTPAVGTVLTLQDDPLIAELWTGTFAFVSGHGATGGQRSGDPADDRPDHDGRGEDEPPPRARHARAARALELLLDDLARLAADDAPFVLDTAYRRLLEAGRSGPLLGPLQALREAHRQVRRGAATGDVEEQPDPVADAVARLLEALGEPTTD
ncbi:MAG: SIR2 family protein [Candidatus Nanopelagicales bacterium]|nr:SIR2 family protein [Candidatus Nanopelagicales bacterium]